MDIQLTELQNQHREHQERRERLFGGKAAVHSDVVIVIAELKELHAHKIAKVKATERANATRTVSFYVKQANDATQKADRLELDVADLQARIIAQAEQICALDTIEFGMSTPKRPIQVIVAEVLANFPGITWDDIKGIRRHRELIRPRHLCMHAVYTERNDLSLPRVGKIFGGKDHSTILHAVQKIRAESKT